MYPKLVRIPSVGGILFFLIVDALLETISIGHYRILGQLDTLLQQSSAV